MKGLATALEEIKRHWALQAAGERELRRVRDVRDATLLQRQLGQSMEVRFDGDPSDDDLLRRAALAYEVAAAEGLPAYLNPTSNDDKLRGQCVAGAWEAFEIRRLLPLPDGDDEKILAILHLSALAYCGERWPDLRRWHVENSAPLNSPSLAQASWNRRVLYGLFDCWRRLFRKRSWDDLDRVREIIAGLRQDQKEHEHRTLKNADESRGRAMALRLVALYHWARASELLAEYMIHGSPATITPQLEKHFEHAAKAAAQTGDAPFEVLLRWLHAAARRMVTGSPRLF